MKRIEHTYTSWAIAAGCLLLLLVSACTDSFDTLVPQGNLSLRLTAISLDEQPGAGAREVPLTRTSAVTGVDENTIIHLWVLQYNGTGDAATLVGKNTYEGATLSPADQNLNNLVPGTSQTLVFVANCPAASALGVALDGLGDGSALSAFKAIKQTITDEPDLFSNGTIPMVGYWNGEIKSNADGGSPIVATIQMERMLAKVNLTVKSVLPNGENFKISSVRLNHVPDAAWLAPSAATPFPAKTSITPIDNYGDITKNGTGEVSVLWYMPENRRGTGTATSSSGKTAANLNAVQAGEGDAATYVEITGDYTVGNYTYGAVYRNYIGGNSVTDYNLARNSAYNVSITIRGKNTSDSRIRVYGQAYTALAEAGEIDNNPNTVPVMDAVKSVRQTGRTEAVAVSYMTVDGSTTRRGFVYSATVSSEAGLKEGGTNVTSAISGGNFISGEYEGKLTGLQQGTTYYVRSFAANSQGETYGPVYTFATPALQGAANCQMARPGQTLMFEPKDALGALKDIDAVTLLWQTRDNGTASGKLPLTKGADLIYDAANTTVLAHINPEVSAANAVIEGTKGGTTVWRWHIWVTPYRPEGFVVSGINASKVVAGGRVQTYGAKYKTVAGDGKAIMDRDLGSQAISTLLDDAQVALDASFHFGMLYQWGYPLPWPAAQRINQTSAMPVYDINGTEITPSGFQTTAATGGAWATAKTAADPCPAGWKVAPEGAFDDLADYGVLSYFDRSTDAGALYIQNGCNAWFFATGWRSQSGYSDYGTGALWTSGNVDASHAYALEFTTRTGGSVSPGKVTDSHLALPVRCIQQ